MGVRIPPPLPLLGGQEQGEMEFLKRAREFFTEVLAEFRRVNWPSRQDLINSTVVVVAVTVVIAFFLGGAGSGKDSAMSGEVTTTATNKQWFVIHTYSGFENKVKEAIESRAKIFGMADKITRVLVPTENVVEFRNN